MLQLLAGRADNGVPAHGQAVQVGDAPGPLVPEVSASTAAASTHFRMDPTAP